MVLLKKSVAAMVASVTIVPGTMMVAVPTAIAAPVGKPGVVMTKAEMSAFDCHKEGNGKSIGWAKCSGTHAFKVRVWCTWAGQGLSDDWHDTYNWAQCNRGSVSDGDGAIEVIWS
jgi:hypothetical protein